MGVSISHSFCPQGPEGDTMRQTLYLVLLGLSCVVCVPEASPNPDANADPDAYWGAWGYGGLGAYGYGGLGAYGYGGLNGGLYRGYGGYGWGRKKRDADALPSADPTADPDADAHWNALGYGQNRWGGLYGGYGLNGGIYGGYGYASPYWRGYGGFLGRR